ncbi:HDOD domain-containing protein [Thiorhodococcus drewsii]|nr:HDOD domain-containing protein [Thiorhodococcus drewsii]
MAELERPIDTLITAHPGGLLGWSQAVCSAPIGELTPPGDIRALIRDNDDLPPLPEITKRLQAFQHDPNASAAGLAEIVMLDPMVAGQILRWANAAYYGLPTPVVELRDAITRVLGFKRALSQALALSALAPLRTPETGPIGRDHVWRHGLLSGRLLEALAAELPGTLQVSADWLQLAGLMHNIGHLLLGHLLPRQHALVSLVLTQNPTIPLTSLERFAIGVEHTQLGAWLLEVWGLPEPLRTLVRHHHNPAYQGRDETLVLLLCLADALLAETPPGIGAPMNANQLTALQQRLNLSAERCQDTLQAVLSSEQDSDPK